MFEKIKKLFKKETFPCIVWDGKIMRYLDLTQKQIDEMNNSSKYKNWKVTKKEEC
ncbi:MAG: hypothetical protein WCR78_12260 [Arcobacteraceae bacterium]|nr:hypothetical protein [Campylobacterales bacterium]